MVHCRGICDNESCHMKWYEAGSTYCPKCTVRFTGEKFIIMNTNVKRCICCHERLRIQPKIHNRSKKDRHLKYIE